LTIQRHEVRRHVCGPELQRTPQLDIAVADFDVRKVKRPPRSGPRRRRWPIHDRREIPSSVGHPFRADARRHHDDVPDDSTVAKELGDTVLNFDPFDVDEIPLALRETNTLERDAGEERAFDPVYLEIG
jgi:hypothetical protein